MSYNYYNDAYAVTPSDSAALKPSAQAFYVGGTGNVTVEMRSGNTVTFAGVPAGEVIHAYVTKIFATGTSATSIVALC